MKKRTYIPKRPEYEDNRPSLRVPVPEPRPYEDEEERTEPGRVIVIDLADYD